LRRRGEPWNRVVRTLTPGQPEMGEKIEEKRRAAVSILAC